MTCSLTQEAKWNNLAILYANLNGTPQNSSTAKQPMQNKCLTSLIETRNTPLSRFQQRWQQATWLSEHSILQKSIRHKCFMKSRKLGKVVNFNKIVLARLNYFKFFSCLGTTQMT